MHEDSGLIALKFTRQDYNWIIKSLLLAIEDKNLNSDMYSTIKTKIESPDTQFFKDFTDEEFKALIEALALIEGVSEERRHISRDAPNVIFCENHRVSTMALRRRVNITRVMQKSVNR